MAAATTARAAAKARSEEVDQEIQELFKKADGASVPVAVVATGGYGRQTLSPHSDVDLLFVVPPQSTDDEAVRQVIEAVLYPLWDSKRVIGHAVRTIADSIEVGRKEMTVRSAMLDHRFVAGDRAVYDRFVRRLERRLFSTDKTRFVRFKLEEIAARRERSGDTAFRNEPDVKEGEGGLRDAQTALWIGRTVWDARTPTALAQEGLITREQVTEWHAATEHLLAVREFLHEASGRKMDRLSFELQAEAAARFGYESSEKGHAAELFMRDLLIHQSSIQRILADVVDHLPRRYREQTERSKPRRRRRRVPDGFRVDNGSLRFTSSRRLRSRPQDMVRIFAISATHDLPVHPRARQAIRSHLGDIDDDTRTDMDAADAFLTLLTHENGASRLRLMNALGLLGAYVPEFEANFCRMQYDKYHVFTVDAHSIQAVQELQRVFSGRYAQQQRLLTQVAEEVERVPVTLGTFLHDVGKGAGSGHVAAGARMVPVICERLGVAPDDADLVLFMELEHLLMSYVAQRRDLEDPKTIRDFAERVGSMQRLRALYLMTFADIRAVGPSTWTEWKGQLLRELYVKAAALIEAREEADPAQLLLERAGERRSEARARLLESYDAADVDAFLDRFSPRYFATTPAESVASDFSLVRAPLTRPVRVSARVLAAEQLTELTFYSKDRRGLFAHLAGVLAAGRLSVRAARIHTTQDGFALDRFEVSGEDGQPVTDLTQLQRIVDNANAVVEAGDAKALLQRARPTWAGPRHGPRAGKVTIEVHNDASENFTVVDLVAPDRMGLLHDITQTLADHELDIAVAIVSTKVDSAADTFYVRRAESGQARKLTDTEIQALYDALREAV